MPETAQVPPPTAALQMSLFAPVIKAYEKAGELTNAQLYQKISQDLNLPNSVWHDKNPVGQTRQKHNLLKRQVRWIQQTAKKLGLIERDENQRGLWRKKPADENLTRSPGGAVMLGFSTNLGLALWADNARVFSQIDEPISLILTSPPYALAKARAYGNPTAAQYVDWLTRTLEPLVKNLVPGGTMALNVSNDIYRTGTPCRDLLNERLLIAIEDRLGLFLLDRIVWENPSKPPAPTQWACIHPYQLVQTWEPVFTFTNDPARCIANNRRVLVPHSDRHQKLIAAGGETRNATYSDGAYSIRPGDFGNQTEGAIARNVLRVAHASSEMKQLRKLASATGLPVHGATMPLALAKLLTEYLCPPHALVADPFGGWGTTAAAAEATSRRWILTEIMREYVLGIALRLRKAKGLLLSQGVQDGELSPIFAT